MGGAHGPTLESIPTTPPTPKPYQNHTSNSYRAGADHMQTSHKSRLTACARGPDADYRQQMPPICRPSTNRLQTFNSHGTGQLCCDSCCVLQAIRAHCQLHAAHSAYANFCHSVFSCSKLMRADDTACSKSPVGAKQTAAAAERESLSIVKADAGVEVRHC